MTTASLHIRDLHKAFGAATVLAGVDLDVERGGITAVLGPSGCGKTTLLRIVAGFESLDAGSVELGGVVVADAASGRSVPPERRRVGIVPQEGALFPHLDVRANVAFGLPRGAESAARVAEMLELVGLADAGRRRPHELSGGQQQRVALARALAPAPAVVLLDEPFSSLDAALKVHVRDEVIEILRASQATVLLVTHDQQEALSVADRVAVLLDGRVAQHADPTTLYEHPTDRRVATFVGDAVVLPGTAVEGAVDTALGRLRTRPGAPHTGPADVVIRPEQFRVLAVDDPLGAALQATGLVATVVGRSFFGHDAFLRLVTPDGTRLTARTGTDRLPGWGDKVCVEVTSAVSAFPA